MRNVSPIRGRLNLLMLLFAMLIVSITTSFAFKTSFPYDNVHFQIIEAALKPVGFSANAMARIDQGAASQDDLRSPKFWVDSHHCDNNQIKEGFDYFRDKCEHAVDQARDCYKNDSNASWARYQFGEGLHALQDFYSHSNWVEMQHAQGQTPDAFRWDLYSPWLRKNDPSSEVSPWISPLPAGLKTGYFSKKEMYNAGGMLVRQTGEETYSIHTQQLGEIIEGAYPRSAMIDEIRKEPAYTALQFTPESEFKERYTKYRNNFQKQIEYVTAHPDRTYLHLELNKDDDHQFEGSLIAPSGKTLHAEAKELAVVDTQRQWLEVEKLVFAKYGGCAGLIIPGFKGAPIPEIRMKITIDRTQQARTRPVKGWVALTVPNLPKPMRVPIKVQLKLYLEPSDDPDTREQHAIEKILEFKDDKEQVINLEQLNLVIGANRSGRYDLVAKACFECDKEFKPNNQRIPLGASGLELKSAKCTPNPMNVGETASLDVIYDYYSSSTDADPPVSGEGYIENSDGTYKHIFNKKKLNPTRGPTGFEPYKEPWVPTQPGRYKWYPKLTTENNENVSSIVEIEVKPSSGKSLVGKATLNKTEGAIGDEFVLNLTYTINGMPRDVLVYPVESYQVKQIDGDTIPISEVHPTVRSGEGTTTRTNSVNYKATKSGVFDWRVEVDVPGYGKFTDTLRFTVNVDKKLTVDPAVLTPETAPPGTNFRLHVDYRLRGMSASSSQDVVESSNITGPMPANYRTATKSISSASGAGSIDLIYPSTTPGDYVWTYEVDAGSFGKEKHSVAFRVEDNTVRSIDLISASVEPVSGGIGTTHTLTVHYRLVGLKPSESAEVHENDYVSFSKQESHSTVTVNVAEPRTQLTKVAGFVSKQSGKHIWNFIIDAKGFKTLYGSVPFDVIEEEVKPQLDARLQYSMLTLAPGETKNCSIYISGYKGNTADRVEIVYPQISDGWGTLPGQIQVFPGNTSMDPWSMRGAGDYTKEYAAGQGYRAKETAPPGTTSVKIIVRQKDVGQVTLTLFVKVVEKNVSTMGTETENPRLPGTYSQRTRPPDGPDIPPTGEPDISTKERGDYSGNKPGTGDGAQPTDGPGSNPPAASSGDAPGPVTSDRPSGPVIPSSSSLPGSSTPGSSTPGSGTSTGAATNDPNEAVYELKEVRIYRVPAFSDLEFFFNSTGEASLRDEGNYVLNKISAGNAHFVCTGVLGWSLPAEVALQRDSSGIFRTSFDTKLRTSIDVTVDGYPAGQSDPHTFGIFHGNHSDSVPIREKTINGNGSYSDSIETPYVASLKDAPAFDLNRKPTVHEPTIRLSFNDRLGTTFWFNKSTVNPSPEIRVDAYYAFKSTRTSQPGSQATSPQGTSPVEEPEKKQLTARLEQDEITVEAGFLPGKRCNILINGWDRTTSKPVEVIYPGQGFLNSLPNDLSVVTGGGRQDPSALSAISSDAGEYTWSEAYEAKRGAAPGVYQVPIIVKQEGAGSVQLVLKIRIVPSRSALGSITMLQNRMTPNVVPSPTPTPIASQQMQCPTPLTPTSSTQIPIVPITQAPACADWRSFAGTWRRSDGVVMAVSVVGNTISGQYTATGPSPQFQFYAGDIAFTGASPTGSDSFQTSNALCFAKKGDPLTPRAVNVRMTAKINCAGDHLYLKFWCQRYANGHWLPGSEFLCPDEYTRISNSSHTASPGVQSVPVMPPQHSPQTNESPQPQVPQTPIPQSQTHFQQSPVQQIPVQQIPIQQAPVRQIQVLQTPARPTSACADWRNFAGTWRRSDGVVMVINVVGSSISGQFTATGPSPQFQFNVGDPAFRAACPTGSDSIETSSALCFAKKGDAITPRAVNVRMTAKINCAGDHLYLQYWLQRYANGKWLPGSEFLCPDEYTRAR